ncbi:spore germination protein [Paenibacillus aurantiacus]|uniref:Spore germination protein n=1 Tax=Paenibacillus aurantiacus TaxID=1936118 RepID=A0ABV5KRV2_9BACL
MHHVPVAERIPWLRAQLTSISDARFVVVEDGGGQTCTLIYLATIIDHQFVQQFIVSSVNSADKSDAAAWKAHVQRMLSASASATQDAQHALSSLLAGCVLLVFETEADMLLVPIRSVDKRAAAEAENEPVVRGPKEAFVEDFQTNIGLIRKRIKHAGLKLEEQQLGRYSNTNIMLAYIDGIADPKVIAEMKKRMSYIDMDGVLASSYIEEFIEDNPLSPFPQVQYTERPDIMAAALLEGRIGIVVDGTPMALLVPVTLYMFLQSAEDYYQRYFAATWIRWIRYLFLMIAFFLPSVYIAITTFHPEMIPPNLLLSVAAARESVPFPAIVEAFIMEISFEAIREAGLRIPKPLGQTVSIIGALIIGQAAVQAGIVSAPLLIVVSITGVASFLIPHFDLALSIRLLRFPVMILAGTLGLYGILISIFAIYMHLVNLHSFGTPYLSPTAPIRFGDWKDVLVRVPWWMMRKRPNLGEGGAGERMQPTRRLNKQEEREW